MSIIPLEWYRWPKFQGLAHGLVDVSYSSDIIHVTVTDIESVIDHLDNNKSCGLDGIC